MYTTDWCGGCHRAKLYLRSWGIEFTEINIEHTPEAAEQVMAWANGKRVVPTFAIGSKILVNPKMQDLAHAVGAQY
jgi:mycoredoxin